LGHRDPCGVDAYAASRRIALNMKLWWMHLAEKPYVTPHTSSRQKEKVELMMTSRSKFVDCSEAGVD